VSIHSAEHSIDFQHDKCRTHWSHFGGRRQSDAIGVSGMVKNLNDSFLPQFKPEKYINSIQIDLISCY
jgi:hypothetical protein